MITHKAGELIGLSWGAYSDYRFNGLYRVLKDIDLGNCAKRYYDAIPVNEYDTKEASDSGFGSWLIANKIVSEIDYDEVHCGSYGSFALAEIIGHSNLRGDAIIKGGSK